MNFMLILQNTFINWSTEYIQVRNIIMSHLKVGDFILFNSFIPYKVSASCAWGGLQQRLSSLYCNYRFACISFRGVWFIPALKDSSKRSINSDWKIELPGEFQIAGTTVRYVRRGLWEKISAKGPTKIPLHLMVTLYPLFVFLKWCNRKDLYPNWKLNFDCLLPHHSVLLQHCRGWTSPAPHSKNYSSFWENRQRPIQLISSVGYPCNVSQTGPS